MDKTFTAMNPRDNTSLSGEFPCHTTEHVDNAANAASLAFTQYSKTPAQIRSKLLTTTAELLEQNAEKVIDRADLETALGPQRLQNELNRTANQLRLFADLITTESFNTTVVDNNLSLSHHPIGPVAVFGASNFPLAFSVLGGDTAAALAAGCPVLIKAHEAHPGTSELCGEVLTTAIQQCGLDPAIFHLLFSNNHQLGQYLVAHPAVKAVAFTGSHAGGKALFDLTMQRDTPIPFYGELSFGLLLEAYMGFLF